MNKLTLTLLASAVAFTAGMTAQRFIGTGNSMVMSGDEAGSDEPLYWVAPMDPNYRRDSEGLSPMGMALVPYYGGNQSADDLPGTVIISPAVTNNLGVRSAPVMLDEMKPGISTVGRIGYDENNLLQINSRVEGWIENLQVSARGEFVRKGDKLFDLYSPALVNAQEEFLSALRSGNRGLIKASKARLLALDIPQQTIGRIETTLKAERALSFYAPRNGYVSQLNTREGGYINPSKSLIELAGLESVWVVADVFERQSQLVQVGQKAAMTVDYLPGKIWQGTVDYIYPELDANTRSLQVRLQFDNPDITLKPNMYSRVNIETESFIALSVPREALIRTGEQDRVVKDLGDGKFRSAKVEIGREVGDRVEILRGLKENERVVTSAQFLLDSESSISADLTRYEEPAKDTVWIEGVIEERDDDVLNISHTPVPEWDWPAMNMDFIMASDIESAGTEQGQAVRFETEKTDDGEFRIVNIELIDGSGLEMSSMDGMSMKGMDMPDMQMDDMSNDANNDINKNVMNN